ncbi:MAG: hypothetical protein AAGE98_15820 [Actinomycetota bacterium]
MSIRTRIRTALAVSLVVGGLAIPWVAAADDDQPSARRETISSIDTDPHRPARQTERPDTGHPAPNRTNAPCDGTGFVDPMATALDTESADVDGDDWPDTVTVYRIGGDRFLHVAFGAGGDTVLPLTLGFPIDPKVSDGIDLDGDGRDEVIVRSGVLPPWLDQARLVQLVTVDDCTASIVERDGIEAFLTYNPFLEIRDGIGCLDRNHDGEIDTISRWTHEPAGDGTYRVGRIRHYVLDDDGDLVPDGSGLLLFPVAGLWPEVEFECPGFPVV